VRRSSIILISGSLVALILGLSVAYPLFVSDFPTLSKVDLTVDIAYFFIQPLKAESNLTGLAWNNSTVDVTYSGGVPGGRLKADGLLVTYLLVLNVTNNSDESARVRDFRTIMGPSISVGSSGSVTAINPIITDSKQFSIYDNNFWNPHSYRLIGLSGVAGVHEAPYATLNSSTTFLYATAEGQIENSGSGQFADDYSFKQVQLQTVGDGYLYNTLLKENQILLFYNGLDVSIATRD
jgi:hypothetical protein